MEVVAILAQGATGFGCAELLASPGICLALPGCFLSILCSWPCLISALILGIPGYICSIPGLFCAMIPSALGKEASGAITQCCVV